LGVAHGAPSEIRREDSFVPDKSLPVPCPEAALSETTAAGTLKKPVQFSRVALGLNELRQRPRPQDALAV
jgi:hypothetical protein